MILFFQEKVLFLLKQHKFFFLKRSNNSFFIFVKRGELLFKLYLKWNRKINLRNFYIFFIFMYFIIFYNLLIYFISFTCNIKIIHVLIFISRRNWLEIHSRGSVIKIKVVSFKTLCIYKFLATQDQYWFLNK